MAACATRFSASGSSRSICGRRRLKLGRAIVEELARSLLVGSGPLLTRRDCRCYTCRLPTTFRAHQAFTASSRSLKVTDRIYVQPHELPYCGYAARESKSTGTQPHRSSTRP
jgi:hypothetical protein